jgi:uncharacterized protein (TIGR02001 family)
VQLSIDYAHESGFYAGSWGSNVDFGTEDPSTEVDVYAGYRMEAGDVGLDFGGVYYVYPSASDLNFYEVYAKAAYTLVSAGVFFSTDFGATDESGLYAYADVGVPVGALTLGLHAGYSDGDSIDLLFGDSYADYSIGLSYSASNVTLGMKWVTADFDDGSDDRVILSISTGLPWGE